MEAVFVEALSRHTKALEESVMKCLPSIKEAANLLHEAVRKRTRIFVCGNGGSAASSQHFCAELVGRYKKERRPLAAIALTTDTSALTAIGNDYGFNEIFARQLQALARPGDLLLALSTSGKSPNIVRALQEARALEVKSVAFTGFAGLAPSASATICIHAQSEETARIQEVHDFILHGLCETIDEIVR